MGLQGLKDIVCSHFHNFGLSTVNTFEPFGFKAIIESLA